MAAVAAATDNHAGGATAVCLTSVGVVSEDEGWPAYAAVIRCSSPATVAHSF